MSCSPLPKAAKPVRVKQLTQLPCLVVCIMYHFFLQLMLLKSPQHIKNQFGLARKTKNVGKHDISSYGSKGQELNRQRCADGTTICCTNLQIEHLLSSPGIPNHWLSRQVITATVGSLRFAEFCCCAVSK